MERYSTPDEARQQVLAVFPAGTGELFYEISTSVAHLHMNWKNYRSLFGTSPERVELLNWAASTFFGLLDGILLHDIVLAIARLTDPAQTGSYINASLERLVEVLEPTLDSSMVNSLKEKLDELDTLCEPIRKMRNKALAHTDLDTALSYHSDPLPGISRAYVEDVLKQIRDFLNILDEGFSRSVAAYEHTFLLFGAEHLIFRLESAREHEEYQKREFEQQFGIKTDDG